MRENGKPNKVKGKRTINESLQGSLPGSLGQISAVLPSDFIKLK